MNIREASEHLGVSVAAVRNWLKDEPSLKGVTKKEGVSVVISDKGVKALEKVKERRFKNASPAMLKMWAGRKAAGAASKAPKSGNGIKVKKNGHVMTKILQSAVGNGNGAPEIVEPAIETIDRVAAAGQAWLEARTAERKARDQFLAIATA